MSALSVVDPETLERHPIFVDLRKKVLEAVSAVPEEHSHVEKVEREFEERILEWEKGRKTRKRWGELEFKTVGRKCKGTLIQLSDPKVEIERDPDFIGWKIVATVRYRCMAARNYGLDPHVIQYSAAKVSALDLTMASRGH